MNMNIINTIRRLIPTRIKIFIFSIYPNTYKFVMTMVGMFMGIKIVKPDPQLPNFYIFKKTPGESSNIVDVGCGFDADFSMYMIKKYNVNAIGADPTLKHSDSLKKLGTASNGKFKHSPIAISSTDGKLEFSESVDNVSGSLIESHFNIKDKNIRKYEVQSVSMASLPNFLDLKSIDYIKLDLEGAEYDLIKNLNKNDLDRYKEIFIEFHHHAVPEYSKKDTFLMVNKLKSFGFKAFTIDEHDYLFYR